MRFPRIMRIWFIRHARAIDREATTLADFQRPLIPRGRKEFAQLCRHLAKRVKVPELLLCSPLVRAVQTAEIAAEEFELPPFRCRVDERLGPDLTPEKLRQVLENVRAEFPEAERIGLVGHEPSFGEVTSACIGGGRITLAKGGIAAVELAEPAAISKGELRWIAIPKLFG